MTDSTGTLSETHSSSSNEPTETQLAEAGDKVQVTEPTLGTTIQLVAAGDSLQLNFDPADVAKVEMKDGNLEVTFKNGSVAVIQGYEEWAAAGGQPTGPQGGVVDVAQLGQPGQTTTAENQAPACEIPNAHVVDVPVPAEGERLTLAVAPGDALRLACSFRDVHGVEVGHNLEMTFPGGGVVVVENFSEWIAAKGATISDCVCGGVNPADFIVALGLNPEDVLPAGGPQGGPQGADNQPTFAPGPGPDILHSYDHPHILPPTALGYETPNPEETFLPVEHNDLGGPVARDDNPDAAKDILTVREDTQPLQNDLAVTALQVDGGECAPPIGPQEFKPDQTVLKFVLSNDDFGPDGPGGITHFGFNNFDQNGAFPVTVVPGGPPFEIDANDGSWTAVLAADGTFTFTLLKPVPHHLQGPDSIFASFNYTIEDSTGDTASANVKVQIIDDVPVANNDCEVCITEGGEGGTIPVGDVVALVDGTVSGNVMANDDKGADQFLGNGTNLTSFTYDNGASHANVPLGGSTQVTTALGGTLTVHSNGDWSYTPPPEVDNSNGDPHDDFTYTITDGDGDTDAATQPICIQDTVEPPIEVVSLGTNGVCIEEDSLVNDPNNQIHVHVNAQGDDHLTQLVITGFNQQPGWTFDTDGMKTAGVDVGASDLDASDGTITLVFLPDVKVFDGSVGVQPPADTDVDLGTLTGTATAAAADDPTKTLDATKTLDVTVDANADPVTVDVTVSDSGDAGTAFHTGETGTAHVHATFGDFTDGSEIHTVTVDIPTGFTYTAPGVLPAGVTVDTSNPAQILFHVSSTNGPSTLDVDFGVTDVNATDGSKTFHATVTANENPPSDEECDTSDADNIATSTDDASTTVANVGTPTITVDLRSEDACIEEDSSTATSENHVDLTATASPGDVLVNLVVTGFDPGTVVGTGASQPTWLIDISTLAGDPKVASAVYDTGTDTLTITFNPGVTTYSGSFSVAPPKDSDVDLGTLTGTVKAADGVDPTQTATSNASTIVNVDANADPVTVDVTVADSGDAGTAFHTGESGTAHVHATFGDFTDGSEIHTVTVDIPTGFTYTAPGVLPAGVTVDTSNPGQILFHVSSTNGPSTLDVDFGVTNVNAADGSQNFHATVTANENPPSDEECDTSAADNIATATDDASTTVANVGTPTITVDLRSEDACIEEDSTTAISENHVDLTATASPGDVLTSLVVTGFDPGTVVGTGGGQATWLIDITALQPASNAAVQSAVYNTATDTLTIIFNPGVTTFSGNFSVAPPKDSDVDLGTLHGTVTAADGVDPTQTATSNASTIVNVDANADPVTVALDVNDSGDANSTFQQNETGTVHVTATFGDFQDGSEIHTVLVDVPDGFSVGSLTGLPAGVTAVVVDTNNVLFTIGQGHGSLDYTFNVTNTAGGTGAANFTATATANENPPSDEECDTSNADNIATAVASDNPGRQDDTPTIVPVPVTVEDDDTPGFNNGPTDETDPPNASATASLGANFGVDTPGTVVFGTNANPTVTSHGEAITYTQSADHKTLTATADAGGPDQHVVYTAVINNDGTYTFTLLDALDHAPGGGENNLGLAFNVTATDQDGDSTGGVINVTVNDDSPIVSGGTIGTVEEDNLPGGIDENPGINLNTSGSFGINFGADGPGDISTITGPAGLTSHGHPVTYSFDAATNTLTGSANGSPVFTVALDPQTGQYTFHLSGPLDHPPGGGDEQALTLNFGFTATDFDGDPVNGNFAVNVRDDVPVANPHTIDTSGTETINIMIVFDRSGSMDEDPNVNGYSTRIDLARAAVAALLETYGTFADVNVKVVDFSTNAASTGWISIEQANAYLAGLEADGTTNYGAALTQAETTFDTGLPDADRNIVYFLSDGKPTDSAGNDSHLGATAVQNWENFASNDSNNIEQVFAVGIGNGIPAGDPDLEAVAFKDANNNNVDDGPSAVVVTDESLLLSTLVSTVANVVHGNVVTDSLADAFGADGPGAHPIQSIKIGADTYSFNGTDILKNGVLFDDNATILSVATGVLGAVLTFDFTDGDYTYKAPDSDTDENFVYTIVDGDGDTASGNLTFLNTSISDQQANLVFGDHNDNTLVGDTNPNTHTDIMGGDDGNDTVSGGLGNDHITGGAGADNLSGGDGNDVIIGGTSSENVDSNIIRAADGNDTIDGGAGNDYLFGNDGSDVIHGGDGNDFIVGGVEATVDGTENAPDGGDKLFGDAGDDTIFGARGDDQIDGGTGNDSLVGGTGNDTITGGQGDDTINLGGVTSPGDDVVQYTSKLDGHDVINNFDSNSTGGQDVLNLDALFDSLGLATANRHVSITGSGTTTVEVNADTNNDGTFDLHVATLHTVDTSAVTVGADVLAGTA